MWMRWYTVGPQTYIRIGPGGGGSSCLRLVNESKSCMGSLRYSGNESGGSPVQAVVRMLILILAAGLLAACGSEAADEAERPGSDSGLVLEVEHVPGGPAVALYADGRVFTPAAQIAIYPGPALPAFNLGQVAPERVQGTLERVLASGVLDADSTPAPDAPTTVVTAVVDGELRVARLGPERAAELDPLLADLPVSSGDRLYEPTALAVFAGAPEEAAEGIEPETRDWPLGDLPPGCSVVRGADLRSVLDAAAQANQLTRWRIAGGLLVGVTFRPLLPHETSCEDVG